MQWRHKYISDDERILQCAMLVNYNLCLNEFHQSEAGNLHAESERGYQNNIVRLIDWFGYM